MQGESKARVHVVHPLEPVYDSRSRVLILGSFPSPKSRETGFYYGHPQNRFWRVMAQVLSEPVPCTNEEKRALLLRRNIALWDVLASCEIAGALDSTIQNPQVNDVGSLLAAAPIRAIFTTGRKATALYRRFLLPSVQVESRYLPSTSPANCRQGVFADLCAQYRILLDFLEE